MKYQDITTLHVGNTPDSYPSVEAALQYVAQLRSEGVGQPITVRLPADMTLTSPICVDSSVSGVTFEPDGKRTAVRGGVAIDGFAWDEYNGAKCLSAPLPKVCLDGQGQCSFTDLYVNGDRAALTRYPAEGYLYPEDVENHEGQLGSSSKWFIAGEGDIKDFRNMDRVQISFCHYWIDEHTPIESYDPSTRRVTFKYASRFNIDGGKGSSSGLEYYLENVGEMFGKPNEWYADGGRIYYIPRDASITPDSICAYAPIIHKLLDVRGTPDKPVRNIRFRNIDFAVTRGEYGSGMAVTGTESDGTAVFASDGQAVCSADGAISFTYGASCAMEGCTVKNYGLHGIVIGKGCRNIRIDSCDLYDGGAGGIKMVGGPAGSPESEHTHDNIIDNCTVLHCGKRYFAACGVLMMHTYNNTVSHNEIGYLYYTGVSVGWVWGYAENISHDNIITKNHIHHLGDGMLSDMGGVYLLGIQPGTVVSNNIIHDVTSKHYGGWALYTDEGSSCMTLENNICYNTSNNSYHQHYGSMNTVRNNIFAFSQGQMLRVSRVEPHLSIIFERNIVYGAGVPMYDLTKEHLEDGRVSGKQNLFFDCQREEPVFCRLAEEPLSLQDMQKTGMEQGSAVADPLFADADGYDFTLRQDSPAWAMGFVPIDTSDVGPRR